MSKSQRISKMTWWLFFLLLLLAAEVGGTIVLVLLGASAIFCLVIFVCMSTLLVSCSKQRLCIQLVVLIVLGIVSWIFISWTGQAEPLGVFGPGTSPAGSSSCTKNPRQQTWPYNPAGWYAYGDISQLAGIISFCPFGAQKWADATLGSFNGTSYDQIFTCNITASGIYATQCAADYTGNLGRGLSHGWFAGALVGDTSLCPGVSRTINSQGIIGTGNLLCATCMQTFVSWGVLPNQPQCPLATTSTSLCWLCPGAGWWSGTSSPLALKLVVYWALFWTTITALITIRQVVYFWWWEDQDSNEKKES